MAYTNFTDDLLTALGTEGAVLADDPTEGADGKVKVTISGVLTGVQLDKVQTVVNALLVRCGMLGNGLTEYVFKHKED